MKRPPTPPHTWRWVAESAAVTPLLLTRARLANEIDTSEPSSLPIAGHLHVCLRCGTLVLYGHFIDVMGDRCAITLYGVDIESMSPVTRPTCELLSRPGELDEDDDDNAVTPLSLNGRLDALTAAGAP